MKIEKKPLLEKGFQEISLYQLDNFFLEPFKNKERRLHLLNRFKAFLEVFMSLGLNAEIWIDGSFTTWNDDPEDIDLAFVLDEKEVDALEGDRRTVFRQLMMERTKTRLRYDCDVYFFDKKDKSSEKKFLSHFGKERDNVHTKGIFKIVLKN